MYLVTVAKTAADNASDGNTSRSKNLPIQATGNHLNLTANTYCKIGRTKDGTDTAITEITVVV